MAEMKKAENKAIYLIYGTDEFPVENRARVIVDQLCPPENQAFGLEVLDGTVEKAEEAIRVVNQCIEALRTVGFLGAGKTVWLKNATFFAQNQLGKAEGTKAAVARLVELLKAGLGEGQCLVVTTAKMPKTSAFYKLCAKNGVVELFDVEERAQKQDVQARERAEQLFAAAGLHIASAPLNSFVERVGMNSRQMAQEVEKLSLYLGEDGTVTDEAVELLVAASRESMAWDLTNAAGNRDIPKIIRLIKQLGQQKVNAVGMVIMLESHFSKMVLLRSLLEKGWLKAGGGFGANSLQWNVPPEGDLMLNSLGKDNPRSGHWYPVKLLIDQATKFSLKELVWCRDCLVEVHRKLVSSALPKELLLELALMEIAGRPIMLRKRREYAKRMAG